MRSATDPASQATVATVGDRIGYVPQQYNTTMHAKLLVLAARKYDKIFGRLKFIFSYKKKTNLFVHYPLSSFDCLSLLYPWGGMRQQQLAASASDHSLTGIIVLILILLDDKRSPSSIDAAAPAPLERYVHFKGKAIGKVYKERRGLYCSLISRPFPYYQIMFSLQI